MPRGAGATDARGLARTGLGLVVLLLLLAACGPAAQPAGQSRPAAQAPGTSQPGNPRGSITVALPWEPDHLAAKGTGGEAGADPRWLFNSPLVASDPQGGYRPMLAERVPSTDNGDWVVNPDGSMVTTYRLRQNLRWHDGVPVTAQDFTFAYRAYTDPAIPFRSEIEKKMSAVEAVDDHTLKVTWPEPYAWANVLGMQDLGPLPRQRLEDKYQNDKANFTNGEEWTSAYIGTGPYRLDRWEAGVRIVGKAFQDWFLGPPKLDTIELRFISDPNTVLANILAGEIDLTSSPPIRSTEALVARSQWAADSAGYVKTWEQRIRYLEYQYREVPNWQRVVTDPRVRKALSYAIDREQMASVMTSGLGHVADVWALPNDPMYPEIDRVVTKYGYDPQRATATLEEAGWHRQPSGQVTNAAGQTLSVDVNSGSAEANMPAIVADAWKAVGVNAGIDMVPSAQLADPRVRSGYTGARVGQRGPTLDGFHFVSIKIPQPPRFNEANYGSFSDPEVDRLYNITVTAFDENERKQAAIGINKIMSEMAAYTPLYYQADLLVAKSSLTGPVGPGLMSSSVTWNVFEWEQADKTR